MSSPLVLGKNLARGHGWYSRLSIFFRGLRKAAKWPFVQARRGLGAVMMAAATAATWMMRMGESPFYHGQNVAAVRSACASGWKTKGGLHLRKKACTPAMEP